MNSIFGWPPQNCAYRPIPRAAKTTTGSANVMHSNWPEWQVAIKVAQKCMSALYISDCRAGMGVFVEQDVLLIPRHLLNRYLDRSICGGTLDQVVRDISIHYSDDKLCYMPTTAEHVLEDGHENDYCLLKLATPFQPAVPAFKYDAHLGECLFAEILEDGGVEVSIVASCHHSKDLMCGIANDWTRPGSSGGIYLDRCGRLIGIHLGQATGNCSNHTGEERNLLLASRIALSSNYFSTLDKAFCPISTPICLHPVQQNLCYDFQGKKNRFAKIQKKTAQMGKQILVEAKKKDNFQNHHIPPVLYRFVSTEDARNIKKYGIIHQGTKFDGIPFITQPKKGMAFSAGAKTTQKMLVVYPHKISGISEHNISTLKQREGVVAYKLNITIPPEAIVITEA